MVTYRFFLSAKKSVVEPTITERTEPVITVSIAEMSNGENRSRMNEIKMPVIAVR